MDTSFSPHDDTDGKQQQQPPLIDPSLLEGLSEEQKREALEAAAAARRAEERAEQRALERALQRKEEERRRERELEEQERARKRNALGVPGAAATAGSGPGGGSKLVYVPKQKRGQPTSTKDDKQQQQQGQEKKDSSSNHSTEKVTTNGMSSSPSRGADLTAGAVRTLSEKELLHVKAKYLGKSAAAVTDETAAAAENKTKKAQQQQRTNKKITFKFRWDDTDDTFDDADPLYSQMIPTTNSQAAHMQGNANVNSHHNHSNRPHGSAAAAAGGKRRRRGGLGGSGIADDIATLDTAMTKPLEKMTARDWRIVRENFEINVRGGRAPPPLRTFRESSSPNEIAPLHPSLLQAIEKELNFKEPTPIQRQAIPIGLQRRDLIGIAETGSGKTVAFGVPLIQYLLNLPNETIRGVADDGPLALVMAPTRELALQIEVELKKLLSRQQRGIQSAPIVGGQSIQQQAQVLRNGVHIIVGTPGRINDCIEMAYLVLNQCSYICLDEADRMIDMGFAPQMESILDAMGGLLKSDQEEEAYQQELADLHSGQVMKYRLTVMFSATMPLEVEKMSKKYLRYPAVISIGDQDSVKNARITQRIVFLSSPSQKETALRKEIMDPRFSGRDAKILVFVNEKKHADHVGRIVERAGRPCVVMHGGKSQEQREENLDQFRAGGVVMVATDVAGRGLDIPNVAHVINYDLPTRSIENYTHRIGRTGRAGKAGWATSFITDEDEGIMAALKSYLESTGNDVPDRLAKHPASTSSNLGNVIY